MRDCTGCVSCAQQQQQQHGSRLLCQGEYEGEGEGWKEGGREGSLAVFSQPQTVKVWCWFLQTWILIRVEGFVWCRRLSFKLCKCTVQNCATISRPGRSPTVAPALSACSFIWLLSAAHPQEVATTETLCYFDGGLGRGVANSAACWSVETGRVCTACADKACMCCVEFRLSPTSLILQKVMKHAMLQCLVREWSVVCALRFASDRADTHSVWPRHVSCVRPRFASDRAGTLLGCRHVGPSCSRQASYKASLYLASCGIHCSPHTTLCCCALAHSAGQHSMLYCMHTAWSFCLGALYVHSCCAPVL